MASRGGAHTSITLQLFNNSSQLQDQIFALTLTLFSLNLIYF